MVLLLKNKGKSFGSVSILDKWLQMEQIQRWGWRKVSCILLKFASKRHCFCCLQMTTCQACPRNFKSLQQTLKGSTTKVNCEPCSCVLKVAMRCKASTQDRSSSAWSGFKLFEPYNIRLCPTGTVQTHYVHKQHVKSTSTDSKAHASTVTPCFYPNIAMVETLDCYGPGCSDWLEVRQIGIEVHIEALDGIQTVTVERWCSSHADPCQGFAKHHLEGLKRTNHEIYLMCLQVGLTKTASNPAIKMYVSQRITVNQLDS